jgi:hypothetical protein
MDLTVSVDPPEYLCSAKYGGGEREAKKHKKSLHGLSITASRLNRPTSGDDTGCWSAAYCQRL